MFGQLHWKEQFKSVLLKKKTKGTTIGTFASTKLSKTNFLHIK